MPALKLGSYHRPHFVTSSYNKPFYRLYIYHERPTWAELTTKLKEWFFLREEGVVLYHCNEYGQYITYASEEEIHAYYQSPFYDHEFPIDKLQTNNGDINTLMAFNYASGQLMTLVANNLK
jgi:hypothetical protein